LLCSRVVFGSITGELLALCCDNDEGK